jgi:hypothetical protein
MTRSWTARCVADLPLAHKIVERPQRLLSGMLLSHPCTWYRSMQSVGSHRRLPSTSRMMFTRVSMVALLAMAGLFFCRQRQKSLDLATGLSVYSDPGRR